jgi:hypothetical protein
VILAVSPSSVEDGLFVWHPASRIQAGGKEKFVWTWKRQPCAPFEKQKLVPGFKANYHSQ